MTNYAISLSSQAYKTIKKLKEPILSRLFNSLSMLSEDPMIGKPLVGPLSGKYSYRFGKYRIIYSIFERKLLIIILDIGQRKNIYDL